MFDERCDDELVALPGSNVKGRVSVLVLTIDVSSYTHRRAVVSDGDTQQKSNRTLLTILDEGLRAGKAPVSGCHVEGGPVVLTLSRWRQRGRGNFAWRQNFWNFSGCQTLSLKLMAKLLHFNLVDQSSHSLFRATDHTASSD